MENKNFFINKNELSNLVDLYLKRKDRCDDISIIEKNDGIKWILKGINTNIEKGIDSDSIRDRIRQFDSNIKIDKPLKGFWKLLLEALEDMLLRILILCAFIIIIINYSLHIVPYSIAWVDGFAIIFAVFLSSGVTAINEYQKELQFKALSLEAEKNKTVTV